MNEKIVALLTKQKQLRMNDKMMAEFFLYTCCLTCLSKDTSVLLKGIYIFEQVNKYKSIKTMVLTFLKNNLYACNPFNKVIKS